jgi:hypothetical protein
MFIRAFDYALRGCLTCLLLVLLTACGGGGETSTSTTNPPTTTPTTTQGSLARLFAPLALADPATDAASKFLKACYFPVQQLGATGQAGINLLESLVIDILPAATATLFHAQTGDNIVKTNRTYRGSDPAAGAPPRLWTGVVKLNADGSGSGFGPPCTPEAMVEAPPQTCYWLAQDGTGQSLAINQFLSITDGRPQTSSGAASLINPGAGVGGAFYFYYEMSFNPNCSAPGSTTLFRGPPRIGRR